MPVAEQENGLVLDSNAEITDILEVLLAVAQALCVHGEVVLTGKISEQDCGKRRVGGGQEDEFLEDTIEEMKGVMETLKAWLEEAKRSRSSLFVLICNA